MFRKDLSFLVPQKDFKGEIYYRSKILHQIYLVGFGDFFAYGFSLRPVVCRKVKSLVGNFLASSWMHKEANFTPSFNTVNPVLFLNFFTCAFCKYLQFLYPEYWQ